MSEQKSLLNKIKKLSVIGVTVAGCWLTQTTKILALPQEVINQKLQEIPVFAIANDQGVPIVRVTENNRQVTDVFLSPQDANSYIELLKKNNPDIGNQAIVVITSLTQVYQMAEKNSQQEDGLQVLYVPSNEQIQQAKQISDEYKGGVPLFVMTEKGEERTFLVLQKNNQEVIPFFFDKQEIQQLADDLKKAQPELASSLQIQVVPLEMILNAFKQDDQQNNELFSRIVLFPSQESIDFIRQNMPQK